MIVFPAIDLVAGKVVRLERGDRSRCKVYSDDPVAQARAFAEQGAAWLHVVDLSAALEEDEDARKANSDAIKAIAEGRVWTGTDALEIGLVDALGGLEDAIAEAAALAGLENYAVEEYPRPKDLTTQLLEMLTGKETDAVRTYVQEHFGPAALEIWSQWDGISAMEGPQVWARLPYVLEFN